MQNPSLLTGRADIHMHTTASDGRATIQQVLHHVAKMGTLDVIAITDHDEISTSLWAHSQRDRYPFDIIPGMEVSSADGHVLALWVTELIPAGLSLKETVAAIHEQGGLAILAHPFEMLVCTHMAARYLRTPEVLLDAGIDAIEIHNSGASTPGNNWLARRLAHQLNLTAVGNSDAHTLAAIGRGVTCFEGRTAADLRYALVTGNTAVEGRSWPITDYLRLSPNLIRNKLNVFSGTNTPLNSQTHP